MKQFLVFMDCMARKPINEKLVEIINSVASRQQIFYVMFKFFKQFSMTFTMFLQSWKFACKCDIFLRSEMEICVFCYFQKEISVKFEIIRFTESRTDTIDKLNKIMVL